MTGKASSIKKNAVLNVLKTAMSLIFPLITFPYTSRVLGPVGIGKVNFAQSIVSYFVMVAMLGITNYSIREAAKLREDRERLSKFVKEILCINLLASIIAYILLFVTIFLLTRFSGYRILIILLSSAIIFTVVGIDWLFYAVEDLSPVTMRTFIFNLIALVLLFVFVKNQEDYLNYALISVFSSVGSNIFNLIVSRKYVDFGIRMKFELKKHIKPIFLFFVMSIAATINSSLDVTMLGFISGDAQVGLYSAALKITRIAASVVASTTVILPRLSYYYSQNNFDELKKLFCKSFNMTAFFCFPLVTGLYLVSSSAIHLLSGDLYAGSVPVLKILTASIFFIAMSNLTGTHLFLAIGKEKYVLYSVLGGILFNILLNSFLIPRYGAAGAASATSVTEAVVTVIQIILAKEFFVFSMILKNLSHCIFSSAVMGIAVYFVQKIKLSVYSSFLLAVATGITVYTFLLSLLRNEFALGLIGYVRRKILNLLYKLRGGYLK